MTINFAFEIVVNNKNYLKIRKIPTNCMCSIQTEAHINYIEIVQQ